MNTQSKSKQETLLQAVLTELERVNTTLQAVAETTAIIAKSLVNGHGNGHGPNVGPNFQRALPEYPTFEWETIGAEIVKWDRHGATVVKWQGLEFFRRRHTDYDASIWFSRYTGQKDENDRKVYARLITFSDRPRIVKGLPDEVTDHLPDAPPVASPPQEQPAPDKAPTNHPKDSPEPPTETKRSAASAATNPRVAFYQLLPQLINAGKLTTEGANQLANIAAKSKPPRRSLKRSEKVPTDTKRSEASTAAPAAAPTAADLLYPKNELDAFFPRE